jgi:hypothetical protein
MDEHTEPVLDEPGSEPAQTDPAERPVYRGPFRQPGLGTRNTADLVGLAGLVEVVPV